MEKNDFKFSKYVGVQRVWLLCISMFKQHHCVCNVLRQIVVAQHLQHLITFLDFSNYFTVIRTHLIQYKCVTSTLCFILSSIPMSS